MEERRKTPRKKSFLKGTIYFNHRLSSANCLIRDFSEQGARLQFTAALTVPDAVELHIPTKDQILPAQVRWRREEEIGVSFGAAPADSDPHSSASPDIARRVEALEREVSKLHRIAIEVRAELRKLRGED